MRICLQSGKPINIREIPPIIEHAGEKRILGGENIMNQCHASFIEALDQREDWLIKRILHYAKQFGYSQYTSTLETAWRMSIRELSKVLATGIEMELEQLELGPDETYDSDPLTAFGIHEADRHRERGTPLKMFLGLYKYYHQTYADLIRELDLDEQDAHDLSRRINRIFDRIEIAYVQKWTEVDQQDLLLELQERNRFLTNEKNKFLTLLEGLQAAVLFLDPTRAITFRNSLAGRLSGEDEAPGDWYYEKNQATQDPPEWLKTHLDEYDGSKQQQNSFIEHFSLDERDVDYLFFVDPIEDVSGKYNGLAVHGYDITLRLASEKRLKLATRYGRIGIWEWDVQHDYLYWDDTNYQLMGITREEYPDPKLAWQACVNSKDRERITEATTSLMEEGLEFNVVFGVRQPDGGMVYIQSISDVVRDSDGTPLKHLGVNWDVTEREQAKVALEAANQAITLERDRVQMHFDLVEAMIISLDSEGYITMINRHGCDLLGYEEDELIGQDWFEICVPGPENVETIKPLFLKIMAGELDINEYNENHILTRDGERRLIAWHNNFTRDDHGRINGTISAGEDITQRKADEQKLRGLLEDRKKFFSILGHDLRGPMGAIVGLLEVAVEDFDNLEAAEMKELLKNLYDSASNTQHLILTLLDWSRVTEGRMQADLTQIPLQKLVRESVQNCDDVAQQKRIKVQTDFDSRLIVEGDYYMLNTALRNLLGNAIKFSYPDSVIDLRGREEEGEIRIEIQDYGMGMNEETRKTLFKPARMVKKVGTAGEKGTGLGLSLTREFIRLHKGTIEVESEEGEGSLFRICLPAI